MFKFPFDGIDYGIPFLTIIAIRRCLRNIFSGVRDLYLYCYCRSIIQMRACPAPHLPTITRRAVIIRH